MNRFHSPSQGSCLTNLEVGIITGLINENWVVESRYDGMDAGIDYDF